jgi:hypothetical protein
MAARVSAGWTTQSHDCACGHRETQKHRRKTRIHVSQVHGTSAAVAQSNLRKCSQTCEPTTFHSITPHRAALRKNPNKSGPNHRSVRALGPYGALLMATMKSSRSASVRRRPVAARAEVGVGTLYRRFGTKEALVIDIVKEGTAISAAPASSPLSAGERADSRRKRLRLMEAAPVGFASEHPRIRRTDSGDFSGIGCEYAVTREPLT